jgi:anti-sigma B factor antagonist
MLDVLLDDTKNLLQVNVDGDIDVNNVRDLKKALEEHIAQSAPNILLDCTRLNYIDSTGQGVLVSSLKKVQGYGGSIKLVNLKPYLNKIFEVTGLTQLFEIEVAE